MNIQIILVLKNLIKIVPHQQYINKIDTEIEVKLNGVLEYNPIRKYAYPHYFNKKLLLEDEDARARFKQLTDLFHFIEQGKAKKLGTKMQVLIY